MYFININITKHVLENEKTTLYCCFTWIVILNFFAPACAPMPFFRAKLM